MAGWAFVGGRSGPNTLKHYFYSDVRYQLSACRGALYKGHTQRREAPANPCPKCLVKVNQK